MHQVGNQYIVNSYQYEIVCFGMQFQRLYLSSGGCVRHIIDAFFVACGRWCCFADVLCNVIYVCIVTNSFVYQPEVVGPATICNHMMIRHECAYAFQVEDIQVAWYRVTWSFINLIYLVGLHSWRKMCDDKERYYIDKNIDLNGYMLLCFSGRAHPYIRD